MTQKQKTPTAYGEVEYETVECASCENVVSKEEASPFVINRGGKMEVGDFWPLGVKEYWMHGSCTEGWACSYCADEGPLQFPAYTLGELVEKTGGVPVWTILVLVGFLIGVLI